MVSKCLHFLGTFQSAHLYDDENRGALLAAAVRGHHGEDVRVTRTVVQGLRAAQDTCSQDININLDGSLSNIEDVLRLARHCNRVFFAD